MVRFGFLNEGFLHYPLKKVEHDFVIPDISVSEMHEYNKEQIRNQIEISVKAEELGYDFVFHPENHFKLLGKNSPTPIQVQVAIAERTEDIRLIQMANILPWHEPVRLAERIAMLDVVSNGRVDVGVGTGSGPREIGTFGQYWGGSVSDKEKNWESFLEKYDILLKAWTEDFIKHHDSFHDIPPTDIQREHDQEYFYLADKVSGCDPTDYMKVDESNDLVMEAISVFPQPEQRPHPQVWKPAGSPRSAEWAARNGVNACAYCVDFSDVKELIDVYYETAEKAGWPDRRSEYDGEPFRYGWDDQRRRGIAAQVPMFNTEVATEESFERWKLGQEFLLSHLKSGLSAEEANKISVDAEKRIARNDAPIVGDSEEIIDQLATFKEVCGYEDFIVVPVLSIPGMHYEEKVEQLRGFAENVMPYFEM